MGVALFLLIKVCFSFDCAWIAPHNNIWADVELSFLKDSFGTKNSKWRHSYPIMYQYFARKAQADSTRCCIIIIVLVQLSLDE